MNAQVFIISPRQITHIMNMGIQFISATIHCHQIRRDLIEYKIVLCIHHHITNKFLELSDRLIKCDIPAL